MTLDLQRALVKESLSRRAKIKREEASEADNPVPYRCPPTLDSVIAICSQKLAESPTNTKALTTRANAYLRKDMCEEALQDCTALLSCGKDCTQAYYIQGCAFEKLGLVDSSIESFTKVLELDPNHVNAALTRASCLNRLGHYSEAIDDYAKALSVDKSSCILKSPPESKHTSKSTSVSTSEARRPDPTPVMKVRLAGGELNDAERKYLQGCAAKKKGDYALAVKLLNECLAEDQGHFKALFNRAFALDKLGDLEAALRDYTAALETDPKSAYAYYNRGILHQRLGKNFIAMEDFTSAIQLDNSKAEFFNNRGFLLYQMGRFQDAADDFSAALKIEPKHVRARLKRARCFEHVKDLTKARADYEVAWKQEPSAPATPLKLARVLIASHSYQEANEVLERAKASDRSSAKWWNLKAEAGAGLGDVPQALIAFSHSLTMEPRNVSTRLSRARILTLHNSHSEAVEDCDRVLSLDPSNQPALILKTEACLRLGQTDRALSVSKQPSSSSRLCFLRGYTHALRDALSEAIEAFSAALKLDPDMSEALHNRGVCYTLRRELHLALADFSAELQLAPTFELAYFCRGYVYEQLEASDQAIVDYEAALKYEQKGMTHEFLLSIEQ